MPLDLASHKSPLSLIDPEMQDVFADLQGNILNGHGRDQALHIFLRFKEARIAAAKELIATLAAGWLTSAKDQLAASEQFKITGEDNGLFVHLALSGAGYAALGIAPENVPSGAALRHRPTEIPLGGVKVPFYDQGVFAKGMKQRRAALQDPPIPDWEASFQEEIHALLIVADDSSIDLLNAESKLRDMCKGTQEDPIAHIVGIERGFGLRRKFYANEGNPKFGENVEHFGYVDGRSQPALLDTQLRQDIDRDGADVWDPTAPPSLVLIKDPGGGSTSSFGSFLVFRKLEQNVKGFKKAQRELAAELKLPVKLVGAMAVGRFEDGTPVVLQPGDDSQPAVPNDFDYSSDKAGRRCPFHAHIRKTNPRGESVDPQGAFAKDIEEERGHRIARRGIPYGGGLSDFTDIDALPETGVGLLFMCYQSDIWEQFEFQQRFWSNNDKFLQPGLRGTADGAPDYLLNTGLDAIIGQQNADTLDPLTGFAAPPTKWPSEWDKETVLTTHSMARFVRMRGGEYFFSPSLSFLRGLVSTDAIQKEPAPVDLKKINVDHISVRLPG
jgi:Dyp-type peroxidase family